LHSAASHRVERAEGLVQQHDRGIAGERSREPDSRCWPPLRAEGRAAP
jgi:hypothetical protein